MKYSQIRIALLTFAVGIASVGFFNSLHEKFSTSYVELPQVDSDTPIVIKVCPRHKLSTNLKESGGGYSGGADNAMCESIPVAISERQK